MKVYYTLVIQLVLGATMVLHNYLLDTTLLTGLTLELYGGYSIAKSTFLNPEQVLDISGSRYGYHAPRIAELIEGKINNLFGIIGIGIGFMSQTITFFISSYSTSVPAWRSQEAILALVTTILITRAFIQIKRRYRNNHVKTMAIKIARLYDNKEAHSRPNLLASIGNYLGWPYASIIDEDGPESTKRRDEYILRNFDITVADLNK